MMIDRLWIIANLLEFVFIPHVSMDQNEQMLAITLKFRCS